VLWVDIKNVVERSATVNTAQIVGTSVDNILVPMYDWTSLLSPFFRRFTNIKQYHHFTFSEEHQGVIKFRTMSDSPVSSFSLCINHPPADSFPDQIIPRGLSPSRQWYLYDKIREYCSQDSQDITCPLPQVPRLMSTPTPIHSPPASPRSNPPNVRVCSKCHMTGHNRRTSFIISIFFFTPLSHHINLNGSNNEALIKLMCYF
jgi:hypothetical protein